jgi:hypothetical protein
MFYRLANNVQVRKEGWGLLFYSQIQHRIVFVKSRDWLFPRHFDGTWSFELMVKDITLRTKAGAENIEHRLQLSLDNLLKNGLIVYELQ